MIPDSGSPASEPYDYVHPLVPGGSTVEPIIADLAATSAFKRLKDVRFLGGIDYMLIPFPNGARSNARYTRYQHSLGVARLASMYADLVDLSDPQRSLACAAALLHDVGHAPLSHSLEPFFEEEFGVNHHDATRALIEGRVGLGCEVVTVLKKHGVDPEQVIGVIEGETDPFDGFFSGPINFDTIEGVLRTRRYTKAKAVGPSPTDIVRAATHRATENDMQLVDKLWEYKDEVYRFVIRSPNGVLADHACQHIAKHSLAKLSKADFYSTETRLFRKLPALRAALCASQSALPNADLPYKVRRFNIDSHADFFARQDKQRYKQTKFDCVLEATAVESTAIEETEWDLFDERSEEALQGILR